MAVETWEGEDDRRREGGKAACGFFGIIEMGVGRGQCLLFRMRGHGDVFHDTIIASAYLSLLGAPAGGMGA